MPPGGAPAAAELVRKRPPDQVLLHLSRVALLPLITYGILVSLSSLSQLALAIREGQKEVTTVL